MPSPTRHRPNQYGEVGSFVYYTLRAATNPSTAVSLTSYNTPSETGKLLVLTIRKPKQCFKPGECEFGKKYFSMTCQIDSMDISCIETALSTAVPRLWEKLAHNEDKLRTFVNECVNTLIGLPLEACWYMSFSDLARTHSWSDATKKKKEKLFNMLLELNLGTIPIGCLSREDHGHALMKNAEHYNDLVTLLRQLSQHEVYCGRLKENPWSNDQYKTRSKQNHTVLSNQHIRNNAFTLTEILEIINWIPKEKYRLCDKLLLLLCLLFRIPADELCELRYASFVIRNTSDNVSTLAITKYASKQTGNKNHTVIRYDEDSVKNRTLPLPTCVYTLFEEIVKQNKDNSIIPAGNDYICPNKKNRQRRMSPASVKDTINSIIHEVFPEKPSADTLSNTYGSLAPTQSNGYLRCMSTAPTILPHIGYELDEIDFVLGRVAKSTAGKHYCDFSNEGELLRMRNLMDLWLGVFRGQPIILPASSTIHNPPAKTCLYLCAVNHSSDDNRHTTLATITIHFPPLQQNKTLNLDHYIFVVHTIGGLSISSPGLINTERRNNKKCLEKK